MKIEPIRLEEIKEAVEIGFADDSENWDTATASVMSLIMAWAHERARALCSEWGRTDDGAFEIVLGDVLDGLNWPKEGR